MIGPILAAIGGISILMLMRFSYRAGVPAKDVLRDAPLAAGWCLVLAIAPFHSIATALALVALSFILERWRP